MCHKLSIALLLTMNLLGSHNVAAQQDRKAPDLKKLDVWVFAGQSNSEGWALLKAPIPPDPHVFFFDAESHWVVAEEPLNKRFDLWTPGPVDANILLQRQDVNMPSGQTVEAFIKERQSLGAGALGGVGPGLMFGKRLREMTGHDIGVISTGVGSPIREWDPDSKPVGKLYAHMLERVRAAGGTVKGLIWYQGESDAITPGASKLYRAALVRFIDGVRRDLERPDLPVICVQTGRFAYPYHSSAADWEAVREAQRLAVSDRPRVWLVSSLDLLLEDDIHVGFEGYRRQAPRIAEIALSQVYGLPGHATPITFDSAELIARDSRRPMIRVKFRGVSGHLKADGRASGFEIRTPMADEDPAAKYPQRSSSPVPIYAVYRIDFDPRDPSAVILGLFDASPVVLGSHHPICGPLGVIYAPGLNPYANITDDKDMPLPAFGPLPVEAGECK